VGGASNEGEGSYSRSQTKADRPPAPRGPLVDSQPSDFRLVRVFLEAEAAKLRSQRGLQPRKRERRAFAPDSSPPLLLVLVWSWLIVAIIWPLIAAIVTPVPIIAIVWPFIAPIVSPVSIIAIVSSRRAAFVAITARHGSLSCGDFRRKHATIRSTSGTWAPHSL
jgi:hypothetical protein